MMAREPAGSLVVPETLSFRKPRVLVVPSQKETLSVPLAGETEPAFSNIYFLSQRKVVGSNNNPVKCKSLKSSRVYEEKGFSVFMIDHLFL